MMNMSGAVVTPPRPLDPLPQAKRWSCAEYHQLGELGLFSGRQTCLIAGVIYDMAPGDPPHETSTIIGADALRSAFGPGFHLRVKAPLVLNQSTDPEPDLAIVPGKAKDYSQKHPSTAALIVEVSYSTLTFDLGDKASLYAAAGIADYWVVDLVNRRLIVHRHPQVDATQIYGHGFATVTQHQPDEKVTPLSGIQPITVANLLP